VPWSEDVRWGKEREITHARNNVEKGSTEVRIS
jgi:hypothetical protein